MPASASGPKFGRGDVRPSGPSRLRASVRRLRGEAGVIGRPCPCVAVLGPKPPHNALVAALALALTCFLVAALGYALASETGSPLTGWLLGAVAIGAAAALLLLLRWSTRRGSRHRRR